METKYENGKTTQLGETKVNFSDEKYFPERNNNDRFDETLRELLPETTKVSNGSEISSIQPTIPDGGYGWMVVFASLVIQLILDGISFSFGLIYTELLSYFEESKTKTAWIGALVLSVPLLSGPIISNLVDKYGCRAVTIVGGLISGFGFILASLSTSVEMLYITFGLISGFGIGIGYVTAIVSIAFWFDKKRKAQLNDSPEWNNFIYGLLGTFATSLGATGTGLGTTIYAPLTQWLINSYGWRGATLILGGTLFNICICGCLMRDPDWLIEENRMESRSQSVLTVSNSSVCLGEIRKMLEVGTPGETVLDTLVTSVNTKSNQEMADADKASHRKKYSSEAALPTYLYSNEFGQKNAVCTKSSRLSLRGLVLKESSSNVVFAISGNPTSPRPYFLASAETLGAHDNNASIASDTYRGAIDGDTYISKKCSSRYSLDERQRKQSHASDDFDERRGRSLGGLLDKIQSPTNASMNRNCLALPLMCNNVDRFNSANQMPRERHRHQRHPHNNGEIVSNLRRNVPLRHSHYFQHMRLHRHGMNYRNAMLNTHRYHLKASSCPDIYRNSMTTLAKEEEDRWYDNFIDIIKSIFDFSMFLDPKFFIFNLSTLLLFIWFIVPYFYITDYLLMHNYKEEDGAKVLSVIGIFSTIGMLVLGYIGDKPWVNVSKTYAACLVVCGVSTALMPLAVDNYPCLLGLGIIFGLSFSSSFSFIPILLVELVDLDDFTCAYGLVLLVQGIGNLIGPPLAGIIFDYTNRWDDSFYAAGIFIAISGVLAWITGVMVARDEEKEKNAEN